MRRPATAREPHRRTGALWGVVLAGGEGTRLQPLTRWATGDGRPKQFCRLTGHRTLLHETIQRVSLRIPRDRQLLSLTRAHACFFAPLLGAFAGTRPIVQPENRGTVLGILYPVLHVARLDPEATVALFPSDHFVCPEEPFMDRVAEAALVVERHPHTVALLGLLPSTAEPEYGWIEPGDRVATGSVARRVVRFVEKPSVDAAQRMLRRGWLWNTLVAVAKASHLVRLGLTLCPGAVEPLAAVRDRLGGRDEASAVTAAYAAARPANFSRDLLERAHESLAVLEVDGVTWSDLGTPRRVIATLLRNGARPAWLTPQLGKALAPAGWGDETDWQELAGGRSPQRLGAAG